MPAASEPPPLPHTWRPLGPRIAAAVFSVVLVGAFVGLWLSFGENTKQAITVLQRFTVGAFVLLGVALLFGLARSRVTATTAGLEIVNGYRRRTFEWAEVVAIRMPPGAPWPTLDLADGTAVSAMGIQGSDGASARTAVLQLRVLIARA